jgi:hypothetical protein
MFALRNGLASQISNGYKGHKAIAPLALIKLAHLAIFRLVAKPHSVYLQFVQWRFHLLGAVP